MVTFVSIVAKLCNQNVLQWQGPRCWFLSGLMYHTCPASFDLEIAILDSMQYTIFQLHAYTIH